MKKFDLLIIGGGAAGIMAAISAKRHHPEMTVAIVDRTFALGRKILVCGAGRCNITNKNLETKFETKYYGADTELIKNVIDQFGYDEIVHFFEELGIQLYEEQKHNLGKIFPTTDEAKTVTENLEAELKFENIEIFLNTNCSSISKTEEGFLLELFPIENNVPSESHFQLHSKYLIISAGGKTYPALGSNGSGYELASSFGHTIIEPVPSGVPIVAKDPLIHLLQRTKFGMKATSLIANKKGRTYEGDVMFTNYGLSGTAILNISRDISIYTNREHKSDCSVILDFVPEMDPQQLEEYFAKKWARRPEMDLEHSLIGLFPTKFPHAFLTSISLNPITLAKDLTTKDKELLLSKLKEYIIKVDGTRGWNEAEFTAGGVDTKDINVNSLESKLTKNLYFCGEILNVDGDIGGFNLSWAWSSGWLAGRLL